MIEKNGDLFTSTADVFAHGVNTKGVMGAGIAKRFREEFPDGYKEYAEECRLGLLYPGSFNDSKHHYVESLGRKVTMLNLATQENPGPDAKYEHVFNSLMDYCGLLSPWSAKKTIAIPEIGCGIGGLKWNRVKFILELVESRYGKLIEFEVWHYA